jgi:toxin ParE1/3/4
VTELPWRIRLGAVAKKDFARILRYTKDCFGELQAAVYKAVLLKTIDKLAAGPDAPGSHAREDLGHGLRTLHVARDGRRAPHLLVYRASSGKAIEILRILHEQMDLPRHVSDKRERIARRSIAAQGRESLPQSPSLATGVLRTPYCGEGGARGVRHCERSEAIQESRAAPGLLRRFAPRNDGGDREAPSHK